MGALLLMGALNDHMPGCKHTTVSFGFPISCLFTGSRLFLLRAVIMTQWLAQGKHLRGDNASSSSRIG